MLILATFDKVVEIMNKATLVLLSLLQCCFSLLQQLKHILVRQFSFSGLRLTKTYQYYTKTLLL